MKQIFLLLIAALPQWALSQQVISGTIAALPDLKPLSGATVVLDPGRGAVTSDESGSFTIRNPEPGPCTLIIRFVGFAEQKKAVLSESDTVIHIRMEPMTVLQPPVEITATRATVESGMAHTNITARDIEKVNTGRDLPYLLESVPSLVVTSDAGNGVGYTGMRIRGSDPTRINVTFNDIPVNDAESQLVYWVDLPDLATSAESIQVQRGAGTSTNGAGAFGGSVNIATRDFSPVPFLHTTASYGTFNTYKTNAFIGTGLLNGKWNFEGRLSAIGSDGYIDRAESRLKSLHISGGYTGVNNSIRVHALSGKERTYQSWYGVPEAALDTNRTWNYYTYENQVDDYQQDHYQALYAHAFSRVWTLNTGLHYTYGRGYYEEYREQDPFADYQLEPVIVGGDTILETDLVRRKWLDNQFYGMTFSVVRKDTTGPELVIGGAVNQYDGDHFGEVIWATYASNGKPPHRYYDNNGLKTDANGYVKATFRFAGMATVYADMQVRNVQYRFTGPDQNNVPVDQTDNLLFFNPKAGFTYAFNTTGLAYISFSTANKEPSRDDYTESTASSRPDHETLYDFECGYRYTGRKLTGNINYYMMLYKNQLVLTGAVNDVGNYTRTNVENSSREGIELECTWIISRKFSASGNATFSRSRIEEFREYYDDADAGGQALEIHYNKDIAFSPGTTARAEIGWSPADAVEVGLSGRYVGRQYLDNTETESRSLDPWFVTDLRVTGKLHPSFMKEITVTVAAMNILDELYESNGYTYSYIYGGSKISENYYYPQAGRNFMVQLMMKF
jgi:iron complex outermembrane receptor protein